LVDTQPNLLDEFEARGRRPSASNVVDLVEVRSNSTSRSPGMSVSLVDSAQCSSCTLLNFLAQVPNLEAYPALAELRRFFAGLPELISAVASRDVDRVLRTREQLGASACYELVPYGDAGKLAGLPKIEILRAKDLPPPARTSSTNRTVLVEP